MGRKKKWRVSQTSCSKGSSSLRIRYPMAGEACKAGSARFPPAAREGHWWSSARHHGNGMCQAHKLLRKRAANTLVPVWIHQRAQEPSQLLLPAQSRLIWKYFVCSYTRDASACLVQWVSHQGELCAPVPSLPSLMVTNTCVPRVAGDLEMFANPWVWGDILFSGAPGDPAIPGDVANSPCILRQASILAHT